jgi:glucose/arabinose dehydrogenase
MLQRRSTLITVLMLASALVPAMAQGKEYPPQAARGLTVPAGFAATLFAQTSIVPTTLAWGPDTAADGLGARRSAAALDDDHGNLLYVGGVDGNPLSCTGCGKVIAFSDEHLQVTPAVGDNPAVVAEGLNSVLGILPAADGTLYVTDNASSRGRVLALKDANGDGFFEQQRVLLKNIPNGRHQTNGLTFGPDGKIYVANGNATDDGIECGPNFGPDPKTIIGEGLPPPLDEIYNDTFRNVECPPGDVERKPWTGSIIRIDPAWDNVDLLTDVTVDADRFYGTADAEGIIDGAVLDDEKVLVAQGFRNIFDVDFRPGAASEIWTPMNGPDDPSGGEPLYGFDALNEDVVGFNEETQEPIYGPVVEDAGFPSCLYDPHNNPFPTPTLGGHQHPGVPEPQDNPNPAVQEKFGSCPKDTVMRPRDIYDEGHEGTSGMTFERGNNFPARYNGGLFTAEWGSLWNLNGGTVTGHKIIHHEVNPDGTMGREREFMTGILPMDVTFGPDGLMYVADMTGQIYQVQFVSDAATPDVVTIDMTNGQFVPQVVNIVQGQTVRWLNTDGAAHTVTCVQKAQLVNAIPQVVPGGEGENPLPTDCSAMNSAGPVPAGGSHTHTFDGEVAVYHYHSTTNGTEETTMRGTIVVHLIKR